MSALPVLILILLPSVSDARARHVAVLDFANAAKDPAVEALGAAIAETLTTKLQATIDALNIRVAVGQARLLTIPVAPAQRIAPTPEEWARLAKGPTRSLDAQEAYGRGPVRY